MTYSKRTKALKQRASTDVIRKGFEPLTHSLEGCCSIQLSYRTCTRFSRKNLGKGNTFLYFTQKIIVSKNAFHTQPIDYTYINVSYEYQQGKAYLAFSLYLIIK